MFASNALPPPTSFNQEHRPLRLTSESVRPQPHGGCHFQNSPGPGQKCLCQTYQHNRSLPGNTCDCGHSACYHSQASIERRLSPDRIVSALVEKIKKLEDVVIKERETRDSMIARERQAWEREVRVLREAMAPFYHTEEEMKRKIKLVEERLNSSLDEHSRLQAKVATIDDASMTLERRVETCELSSRSRKRKASLGQEPNGVTSPESNYTCSSSSAASDTTSVSTQISPQPPSPINLPMPANMATASPRSSGFLNLKSGPRYSHAYQPQMHKMQLPSPEDEPRSSGFLSIDLAERLRRHKVNPVKSNTESLPSISTATNGIHTNTMNATVNGVASPPHTKVSSGALPLSGLLSDNIVYNVDTRSIKRHKPQRGGMMALEVLANATVANP